MHRLVTAAVLAATAVTVPTAAYAGTSPVDQTAGRTYVAGATWGDADTVADVAVFADGPGRPGHLHYYVDRSQFPAGGGYNGDFDEIDADLPSDAVSISPTLGTATVRVSVPLHHSEWTEDASWNYTGGTDTTTTVEVTLTLTASGTQVTGSHVDHYAGGDGPGSLWLDVSAARTRTAAGTLTIDGTTVALGGNDGSPASISDASSVLLYRPAAR